LAGEHCFTRQHALGAAGSVRDEVHFYPVNGSRIAAVLAQLTGLSQHQLALFLACREPAAR
jgi:hypothetical protein